MSVGPEKRAEFVKKIWEYYEKQGRHDLPWRHTSDPYRIFVSEVMLQQTQVGRVLTKYPEWLERFPNWQTLASSTPQQVIHAWQGMGYNRRALSLRLSAQKVVEEYNGVLPSDPSLLITFPGIGATTSGSIAAFAFNSPTIFIETNIRRVYIHAFFPRKGAVTDDMIIPILKKTVPQDRPREWYWALMDYGSYLVKQVPNPNRRSAHYTRQSQFEGSNRQIRGAVLRHLVERPNISSQGLAKALKIDQQILERNLGQLLREGFLEKDNKKYRLKQ